MSAASSAEAAAAQFIAWDVNEETRAAASAALAAGDAASLAAAFGCRLEFGTAGLRGPMGAGFNRMNDLVVLQTAQVRRQGVVFSVWSRGEGDTGWRVHSPGG